MAFLPTPVWRILQILLAFNGIGFIFFRPVSWLDSLGWLITSVFAVLLYLAHLNRQSRTYNDTQPFDFIASPANEANIVTFFAHGLWPGNPATGYFFTNGDVTDTGTARSAMDSSLHSCLLWSGSRIVRLPVFPNVHSVPMAPGLSLHGEYDVTAFTVALCTYLESYESTGKRILIVGHSWGVMTVMAAIALLAKRWDWEEKIRPRIHHVVCLAPFATVEDVLAFRFQGRLLSLMNKLVTRFLIKCAKYTPDNVWEPFQSASHFPHNVPLSLVWSVGDDHVPASSAARLYAKLKERNLSGLQPPLILAEAPHELPFATGLDHRRLTAYLRDIVLPTTDKA